MKPVYWMTTLALALAPQAFAKTYTTEGGGDPCRDRATYHAAPDVEHHATWDTKDGMPADPVEERFKHWQMDVEEDPAIALDLRAPLREHWKAPPQGENVAQESYINLPDFSLRNPCKNSAPAH